MQVFFFMSEANHQVFGFSLDTSGANLPSEFAPWQEAGSVSTKTVIVADVMVYIKRDGNYLFRSRPMISAMADSDVVTADHKPKLTYA